MNDYKDNYIPSQENKINAYQVYQEVIISQVLRPESIRSAHKELFGDSLKNLPQMKREVFFYFQNEKNMDFLSESYNEKSGILNSQIDKFKGEIPEFKGDKRSTEYKEFKEKYGIK